MPNPKQIEQWNISVYWFFISYDILAITLISHLPLRKGWWAISLLSSSECSLKEEERACTTKPMARKTPQRRIQCWSCSTDPQQVRASALLQEGSRQSIWDLPRPSQFTCEKSSLWQAGVSRQSITKQGKAACPGNRLKEKETQVVSRDREEQMNYTFTTGVIVSSSKLRNCKLWRCVKQLNLGVSQTINSQGEYNRTESPPWNQVLHHSQMHKQRQTVRRK